MSPAMAAGVSKQLCEIGDIVALVEAEEARLTVSVGLIGKGFFDMPRYYFDTHDGDEVIIDDVGLEFSSLEAVKTEAARSLADLARDILPGSVRRELAVLVRDAQSRQVLRTALVFEIEILETQISD